MEQQLGEDRGEEIHRLELLVRSCVSRIEALEAAAKEAKEEAKETEARHALALLRVEAKIATSEKVSGC